MKNHYETVFILTPVLSEVQIKEAVDKFKGIITENGGEVIHEDYWGLKKLAYPIQNKSTGFYHMMQFKSDGQLIKKLEVEYKREERVIRFLTVKLEKYAQIYAEKRRNMKKETQIQEN